MQAVIMAGGQGSRLRPLTNYIPKPLIKIIDKPVMEYIVESIVSSGIREIAVTIGYRGDMIMEYFQDGRKWGADIKYFVESTPLGTAGGVRNAKDFIYDDFLVLSADGFSNIDLKDFANFHRLHSGKASMAVKRVSDARGFGLVKAKDNLILSFEEKPKEKCSGLVNMGIYAFDKEVIREIPKGYCDFSYDIFPKMLGDIYCYKTNCFWSDIGTLPKYYSTNEYVCTHPDSFGLSIY